MAGPDGTSLWLAMRAGITPDNLKGLVDLIRELTPDDWDAGVAAVAGMQMDAASTGILLSNAIQHYEGRIAKAQQHPGTN